MHVRRLQLTGFRSYPELVFEPPQGPQVLFGPNAAGKTSLVEALVVLARGSSHRTSDDRELIRWGEEVARLEVTVGHTTGRLGERPVRGDDHLEVALGPGREHRKRILVNGVGRRAGALAEGLQVVLFAPEEMLLIAGGPALRRAALDALAGARSPLYTRTLATYGRALAQRNSLLRRIREGEAGPAELPYWDGLLVQQGGQLVGERLVTLKALAGPLAAAHAEIAPGEGRLTLRYLGNAPMVGPETPEEALRRRLAETAEKELWNGMTLVGPHRDDLAFELDGRDMAGFASRGQQRTAILALKLAESELLTSPQGEPPLLLLDDVFSELDPQRRGHLVRRIRSLPQALITTTALEDLDPALVAESTAWLVAPGRVQRVPAP